MPRRTKAIVLLGAAVALVGGTCVAAASSEAESVPAETGDRLASRRNLVENHIADIFDSGPRNLRRKKSSKGSKDKKKKQDKKARKKARKKEAKKKQDKNKAASTGDDNGKVIRDGGTGDDKVASTGEYNVTEVPVETDDGLGLRRHLFEKHINDVDPTTSVVDSTDSDLRNLRAKSSKGAKGSKGSKSGKGKGGKGKGGGKKYSKARKKGAKGYHNNYDKFPSSGDDYDKKDWSDDDDDNDEKVRSDDDDDDDYDNDDYDNDRPFHAANTGDDKSVASIGDENEKEVRSDDGGVERSFDLSDCENYSNEWMFDLASSCSNSNDDPYMSSQCECAAAEKLIMKGSIDCSDYKCPNDCPVCKMCLKISC